MNTFPETDAAIHEKYLTLEGIPVDVGAILRSLEELAEVIEKNSDRLRLIEERLDCLKSS